MISHHLIDNYLGKSSNSITPQLLDGLNGIKLQNEALKNDILAQSFNRESGRATK